MDREIDAEARLTEMVETYQSMLLRTCSMILKDAAIAQDAVQKTFLNAYKSIDSFRGACSEKTWLTSIAVNVCRDMMRDRWHRFVDKRVDIANLPETGEPFPTPEDRLIGQVLIPPRRLRIPVLLYYYQDMTLAETASALGVAVSTVSRRLKAAENRLRILLEEERA